jgi:hypothetical protein
MSVYDLLKEYDLSLDDVRWYLSHITAHRFLSYREEPEELCEMIWSGKVESELYNMEERFLQEKQEELERGLTDEEHLREIYSEIDALKRRSRR